MAIVGMKGGSLTEEREKSPARDGFHGAEAAVRYYTKSSLWRLDECTVGGQRGVWVGATWISDEIINKAFSLLYPYSTQVRFNGIHQQVKLSPEPEVVTKLPRYPKNSKIKPKSQRATE